MLVRWHLYIETGSGSWDLYDQTNKLTCHYAGLGETLCYEDGIMVCPYTSSGEVQVTSLTASIRPVVQSEEGRLLF